MLIYLATIIVLASIFYSPIEVKGDWNNPASNQYHIQTDEGPERYFRYQTDSGQYRKEKRLEDGTVIGSYAWIDDNGILLQRDYIADSAGYRILKTKNIFVGRNVNVGDAVKGTKNYKTFDGVTNRRPDVPSNEVLPQPPRRIYTAPNSQSYSPVVEVSPNAFPSSTPTPFGQSPPVTILPPVQSTTLSPLDGVIRTSSSILTNIYSSSTVTNRAPEYVSSTPASTLNAITSNLASFSTSNVFLPSSSPKPSSFYGPSETSSYSTSTPPSIYLPSSTPQLSSYTPSHGSVYTSTPPSVYQPSSETKYPTAPPYIYLPSSTPLPPLVQSNSIEYSGSPQYEHYPDQDRNPYIRHNGPTYPLDTRGQSFNPRYNNNLGNGYDPQYPYYDGISVTNDGFRYYIPRAYHEEQSVGEDRKSGSFGYIDPFGIRRVIYYNAGPDGFKHRKNNRYVGFNATPYDPRPN